MNNSNSQTPDCCCCKENNQPQKKEENSKFNSTFKIIRTSVLSILIAFFPKCPVCWAVYMSMFGSLGLSQLPYMGWLFPILLGFLGLHLFMQFKKSKKNHNYIPFYVSTVGVVFLLIGRSFLPENNKIIILGMLFIISGSLISSFSTFQFPILKQKHTN